MKILEDEHIKDIIVALINNGCIKLTGPSNEETGKAVADIANGIRKNINYEFDE